VQGHSDRILQCRPFTTSNSNLSGNEIRNIFQDKKGRFWIATTFGLNLMKLYKQYPDSVNFIVFTYEPLSDSSISYNDIVHIFESTDGAIWFATFGGGVNRLIRLSDSTAVFQHLTHTDGLVNDAVFGILQDATGNLWFSTERGISKFDPVNAMFENYDQDNGLQSDRFSENTCTELHNGRLLYGSTSGILVIDPKNIVKESYVPPVVLTNFQLFNKDIDIHAGDAPFHFGVEYLDRIVLKHYQSSFSVEYAALSYFDPHKNTYQFMLEGFEEHWNDVGNLTRATYTNLSPGKYKFRVKASGWDGAWNPTPRDLEIIILPPWYKTFWAFVIYCILFGIIIEVIRRTLTRFNRMRRDLLVERRVNDIKLQFFTNVSHEIRTPLTLVLGPLADIKMHAKLPASLRRSVEIMDLNGRRMLRLVNQLLDFRKIQKDKMRLKIRGIDIVQFVSEVIDNFSPLARQKGNILTFDTEINHLHIWADPDKLDSVLFNILSNAFKFTPQNKKIAIHICAPQNDYVEIQCTDEGKGIPKGKIPVLFQRFTPLAGSDVNYQGTGIGLALSYEIMKLHGGEIDVVSEEGKGSKFSIRIRIGKDHFNEEDFYEENVSGIEPHHRKIEELDEYPDSDNTSGGKGPREGKSVILLVEDNNEIVGYVQHILEPACELLIAQNGIKAFELLRNHHPDLIITDVMMPEMDGIELTLKIKDNFELSHIPVIMLTAKSQIEDQIHGIESGAEAYILKPFNAKYLQAIVRNILRQRDIVMKHFIDKGELIHEGIKITSKDEKFMQDIVEIIKKNYSNPEFNVERLVDHSTVGRTVFYNKIKGLTGSAPVEFLRSMRLKIACDMLIDSGYNVSEVGYMCGFNDIKYFSKCFKAQFGLTPSDYKNKHSAKRKM
jgi:signal transduction histidine kinase/DNA-binding response OmpR family regulator